MPSRVTYAGNPGTEAGSHHLLDPAAATVLAAVILGIYLGMSTISEIDPIYRNAQPHSGNGSYTIDGWRGADAVSPPAPPPAEAPMAASRVLIHVSDRGLDDAMAEDRAADDRDCPDCAAGAPISVEPIPEAAPALSECAIGDPACAPDGQDGEAAVDPSAQPADF